MDIIEFLARDIYVKFIEPILPILIISAIVIFIVCIGSIITSDRLSTGEKVGWTIASIALAAAIIAVVIFAIYYLIGVLFLLFIGIVFFCFAFHDC